MNKTLKNTISILFLTLSCLISLEASTHTQIDSIISMPLREDAEKSIESYLFVANEKIEQKNYHEAKSLLLKTNKIIKHYDLGSSYEQVNLKLGKVYYKTQNYNKTIEYLNIFINNNPDASAKDKSDCFHVLSLAYRHLGDLILAFDYELLNLEIVENSQDTLQLWYANYQLGNIHVFQDDYHAALDYYFITEDLANKSDTISSSHLYSSWGAIGNAYNKLDSIEIALEYNLKALALAEKIDYGVGISYSHHNVGNDYFSLKNYDEALKHHLQSLELKIARNDKWGIASSCRMLGYVYMEMGDYQEANSYLAKAEKLSIESGAKPMLVEIYDIFAKLYLKTGNHKMANKYLGLYIETKEEIRKENALLNLKSKKTAYEINKRDKEINSLKEDQEIQHIKTRAFSYVLLAILPFIILLMFAYNRLRKVNNLLESKNVLIEKQNIALEESNKELEQFAYVASHDMREPIRTIRSFNSLLKRRFENVIGERGLEFVNFIDDASNRMDIMLTDLLDYSRVNTKDKNKSVINLTDSAYLAAKNLTVKLAKEDVNLNVSKLPQVEVNPIQMERLFQNLIANGVKYNDKEKKIIDIDYKKNGKAYIISVTDNGIGISDENKDKVFEIFRRLHGTSEYEGSGIGLATCKKIVERHEGEIWIDSEPKKGTTVFFSIPFHEEQKTV